MPGKYVRIITLILLIFSAIGVTISGPLIFDWFSVGTKFFDLGSTAATIGGFLDIIGGGLEFAMIGYMFTQGVFSSNADRAKNRRLFMYMAGICVIGVIGDPLGGLLAIAAQIGLYTSIANIYLHREKKS